MRRAELSDYIRGRLRCPACHSKVVDEGDRLVCRDPRCGIAFPVINGTPVLLDERRSVFSNDDFIAGRDTTFAPPQGRIDRYAQQLLGFLPSIGGSIGAKENYERFCELLLKYTSTPRVLVLGGSILGHGMEALATNPSIELVGTDVSMGPLTALVCDAHDIPFEDETFDGVIAQAVLEHVVDPYRTVHEMHRVLKPDALVYAETPFMQQVHMGPYDFTRFTHSGHRRLFREFTEIASGPICGPGMALAWSYTYFLLSFTSFRPLRGLLRTFASLTAFYLKYFDYYLIGR
jgi:SAM-dependent methyltransferase